MELQKLEKTGQIKAGDLVLCYYRNKLIHSKVLEVINEGENEEYLLNRGKNLYFIASMAIDGSSWAENVHFITTQKSE